MTPSKSSKMKAREAETKQALTFLGILAPKASHPGITDLDMIHLVQS